MRPQAPSYIARPADEELFEQLCAGEFCYVLTARQLGKSSLMVRTARRLAAQGIQSVVIDLTAIGTVGIDAWYLGLLSALRSQLRLPVEPLAWWAERAEQSAPQRLRAFLKDVALAQGDAALVIFIDEIDATLGLPFRDDFFAAIRALFNDRDAEPCFARLTFALFGVAAPTDLIQDQARTPFNIGRRVELGELSLRDAEPLREALDRAHPGQGELILARIFHWTGGHPFLTQKLCAIAAPARPPHWDNAAVDALVQRHVLDEQAGDENLKFVQNRVYSMPPAERRAALHLYRQIYRGARVPDNPRSLVQNRLELTGLVVVARGRLYVRNAIYLHAFDRRWIAQAIPPSGQQRVAIASALLAGLIVALLLGGLYFRQPPADSLAQGYIATFMDSLGSENAASHTARLDSLARLFALHTHRSSDRALMLFYDTLNPEQQQNMFKRGDPGDGARMLTVAREVGATLGAEPDGADQQLLRAMSAGLARASQRLPGVIDLQAALRAWDQGRQALRESNAELALQRFAAAPESVVAQMPALLYDRALARIRSIPPNYPAALGDLSRMLDLATHLPTPEPATATGPTALPSAMPGASGTALLTAAPPNGSPAPTVFSDELGSPLATPPSSHGAPGMPALRDTERFRNEQQIRRSISALILGDAGLREAYRTSGGAYAQLAQLVGQLPASSPTALPTQPAIAEATVFSAAEPSESPLPADVPPNLTPASGLRPALSDLVDLLPVGPTPYATRQLSAIDTIIFRATDSGSGSAGAELLHGLAEFALSKDYPGISYHFVIDRDGTIYQTNRLDTVSYHSAAYNQRGVGIAMVTFLNEPGPRTTEAQQRAAAQLSAWLLSELKLPVAALKDRSEIQPQFQPSGVDIEALRAEVAAMLQPKQ